MEKVYFIGINGIGMSGLAKIMKVKGYDVKGADICKNYVTEQLLAMDITVYNNHDADKIKDVDFIVASSAIKENNPEYSYALKNNIKIMKRGELLAKLLNESEGIAIAGTHGKTTTTSMFSSLLLETDPTIVVGGILPEINSNSKVGLGKYFIAEADESDNSFLYMKPKYSVVTNIDIDHLDVHENLDNIKNSFIKFINNTEKEILLCADCQNIKSILDKVENRAKIKTYSIKNSKADIYANNIRIENKKTIFDLYIRGEKVTDFTLSVPGEHNIQNSLPAIYFAIEAGISLESIKTRLEKFRGSKRRYDVLFDGKFSDGRNVSIRIIDDYAHHPTEISATLKAAKSIEDSRIVAIFQPHRYSRINFLLEEFKNSFELADKLILMPIYAADEENIYNISTEILKEKIGHKDCEIISEEKDIKNYLHGAKKNTSFIFMGAGDISSLAHRMKDFIKNIDE